MGRVRQSIFSLAGTLLLAACSGSLATGAPGTVGLPTEPPVTESPSRPPATAAPELTVVAVGDSIPYNSPEDCPACKGFVQQYADALAAATARTVGVRNLSEHNNNTVELLLQELEHDQLRMDALAAADVIIVGIAHNDVPMNRDDDSCDGVAADEPDWSKFTDACLETEIQRFTPVYHEVFARIADMRDGSPTILRTINRYNDWIGWPDHPLPAAGLEATARVIAAWNDMICAAAQESGFGCADISTAFNNADGKAPAGDLLAGDYTHPSQLGNDAIAETLERLGYAPLAQ